MYRSYQYINRRKSKPIKVGQVKIGDGAPISVQTMTNTLTKDIKSTINQINRIEKVGADLVRVSVPDQDSSLALKTICKKVSIPIIADVHFHYKRAIESAVNGVACLRINPGNIGSISKVKEVIKAAKDNNCSIRIGVNGGSLEKNILEKYGEPNPDALVESAMNNVQILENNDFFDFNEQSIAGKGFIHKISQILFNENLSRMIFVYFSFFISWIIILIYIENELSDILTIVYLFVLSVFLWPMFQEYFDPLILLMAFTFFRSKLIINYKNSTILYIYLSILLIGSNIYYANLLN